MVDAKSIYGTGSSSAHVYYVTKWRTTYTQYRKYTPKKWRLSEVIIFLNCDIDVHCALENGADLCVNDGQYRVSS